MLPDYMDMQSEISNMNERTCSNRFAVCSSVVKITLCKACDWMMLIRLQQPDLLTVSAVLVLLAVFGQTIRVYK